MCKTCKNPAGKNVAESQHHDIFDMHTDTLHTYIQSYKAWHFISEKCFNMHNNQVDWESQENNNLNLVFSNQTHILSKNL